MTKYFFIPLVLLLSVALNSMAQEATPPVKAEKKEYVREDMMMMDFNWNTLWNTSDSMKTKLSSWGYTLKLMYDVPLQNSQVSFGVGGSISVSNLYSDAEVVTINRNTDSTFSYFQPIDASRSYKRNKLTVTYADIPAEFRYRSKPDKRGFSWKVAVGGKIGYHLQTHSKIKENDVKYKTYDFPNYKKWRYGFNLRVGYGKVGFNAFYSATSLFEDNKGEKVYPVSIGLTLMPF